MEWEIARTTIAAIAVLVTVYFYVRRIQTNHIETLRKDIKRLGEKLDLCEGELRKEIQGVHHRLDEHLRDHWLRPNPGGSDG